MEVACLLNAQSYQLPGLDALLRQAVVSKVDVCDGAVDLEDLSQGLAKVATKSMDII